MPICVDNNAFPGFVSYKKAFLCYFLQAIGVLYGKRLYFVCFDFFRIVIKRYILSFVYILKPNLVLIDLMH